MSITLSQILALVGELTDAPGDKTPRERFRRFLKENAKEVGQVRDYVEKCLRISGNQYNRALQDLVNHLGGFLEFEVTFGRYQGVPDEIGFDGHWISPTGFHIVVEVKTTEVYAIKTATLLGYVDRLVSEKKIPDRGSSLGLYVIGRPDSEIRQIENAIVAEKRTHQLRIISVESLLSLAEMMNEYDISHKDIQGILHPSGPRIDSVVDLMARLVGQRKGRGVREGKVAYWLTPIKSDEERTAEEAIQILVGKEQIYVFGERTPGRKRLRPGDWICFYATGKGVIAHAKVISKPEKKRHPKVRDAERYPWLFRLENPQLYLDNPIVLDAGVRSQLNAFQDRDPNKPWAWFVQTTRSISQHDFKIVIRERAKG